MTKDIAKFVNSCHKCKLTKPNFKTKEPLRLTETPSKPFDIVQIDTIGPMTKSQNGFVYAVTMMDELTKYLVTIPIENKSARSVAEAIFNHFILIHGPMRQIKTDLGTEYVNEILKNVCELLKIEHSKSTAYHHQTLGQVERNHRLLNEYSRSYLIGNLDEWDVHFRYFTFCYNICRSTTNSTKYSPFELIYGHQVNTPYDLGEKAGPIYNTDDYA